MQSDIAIARQARLKPITQIAEALSIPHTALMPYGHHIAKVDRDFIADLPDRSSSRLILVTAINPTAAGEGKTTTTIGLGDALNRIGRKTMICLREPSLGPCFGVKGGATGGGLAQVLPMEQINLHFTGDFHAIGSAHNLLSAMLDNHIYWGNGLAIDSRRVTWPRALDMNDRALRSIISSLGGAGNGYPREDGFVITVASEVMAAFCMASSLRDLEARLGAMIVARSKEKQPITAKDLKAHRAMAVLLKDAFAPNLVQTLEGNPAFIHGGPFANIAHGCNSLMATRAALKLADYVVTEAGFGADLGAEKFFDIKCRTAGLRPAAAVIVATVRALKMHGGVLKADLGREDLNALQEGFANLRRHIENVAGFGVPVVVAINRFMTDTPAELALIQKRCREDMRVEAVICSHWSEGSKGAEELAKAVEKLVEMPGRPNFRLLYPDDMPLLEKTRQIAKTIYGAADITADAAVIERFGQIEAEGHGHLPICMAKTPLSFSADPTLRGAPSGHVVPIRDVLLSAGAGFAVALCGDIMRMPGLPRTPSAEHIYLDDEGQIEGLS